MGQKRQETGEKVHEKLQHCTKQDYSTENATKFYASKRQYVKSLKCRGKEKNPHTLTSATKIVSS